MKLFLSQIIFNIYLLIKIIAGALNYQGFPKICHQIVQHSFQLFDHGHDYTQITECKFVNVEVDVHDSLHKDNLKLKIFYHNKQIESLELRKTDGLLANGSTPVYVTKLISGINYTDVNTNYVFETLNIDKFVPEMGNFTLYHDKNKTASIIVFRKFHSFHVEGNIGNHVLRRLPHIYYLNTKYVYLKLRKKEQENEWNNYINNTNLSYDLQVPALNNVTINFFVILDSSSVSNTPEEFMATLLMYYNFIDMFHGNFTSPKIRFSIKGIVIPASDEYIPYLGNNRIGTVSLNISRIQTTIQKMVKVHNKIFNLNSHDIITIMSQRQLCDKDVSDENEDDCYVSSTYSDNICQENKYPNIIISVHADFQGFHGIFLEALSSILGYYEETDERQKNCTGFVQEEIFYGDLKYPLSWSPCIIERYSNQFKKFDCSYFNGDNKYLILNNTQLSEYRNITFDDLYAFSKYLLKKFIEDAKKKRANHTNV